MVLESDLGHDPDGDDRRDQQLVLGVIRHVFSDQPAFMDELEECIPRLFSSRSPLNSSCDGDNLAYGIGQTCFKYQTNCFGTSEQSLLGGSSQSPTKSHELTSSEKQAKPQKWKGKGREDGDDGDDRKGKKAPSDPKDNSSGDSERLARGRLKCAFWDAYPEIANKQGFENCAPPTGNEKRFQDRRALL
jgi:hypothetical protein